MEDFNIVIGIHSIICALKNSGRQTIRLVGTEDALDEIKKSVDISQLEVDMYVGHKVQEEAKKYFRDLDLDYHRVPSGVFLVTSELMITELPEFYRSIENNPDQKILCLDQISDVHNAAAILRTASFYGIDYVVVPDKKSFGLTPSFFRIASGAAEYVKIVRTGKLTKTLKKIQDVGVTCLALSEHAEKSFDAKEWDSEKGLCLVLGKEDTGISNAVLRLIENRISLESQGDIKSLNVSIAAAVTMEKCFSKNK